MSFLFSDRSRKVLAQAREEADTLRHDYLATEHILLGLIRQDDGVAVAVLLNLQVDLEQVRERINASIQPGNAPVTTQEIPYTTRAKSALEYAIAESRELNHAYVGTAHLLLGLLRERECIAAQVLQSFGVTYDAIRNEMLELRE
jgi:ATP-dependent Clp protease ATP-binding subunit ClpC